MGFQLFMGLGAIPLWTLGLQQQIRLVLGAGLRVGTGMGSLGFRRQQYVWMGSFDAGNEPWRFAFFKSISVELLDVYAEQIYGYE